MAPARLLAAATLTLLATALLLSRPALALEIVPLQGAVRLVGPIEPGDFAAFEAYMLEHGDTTFMVELDSRGGDIVEAIRIGRFIRQIYLSTWMTNVHGATRAECLSACVFVLAGGIERRVNPNARYEPVVGLHRPYFDAKHYASLDLSAAKDQYAAAEMLARSYLQEMGIDPDLIERMFRTPSSDIDILSDDDLDGLTWIAPYYDERLIAACGALSIAEDAQFRELTRNGAPSGRMEDQPVFQKLWNIKMCRAKVQTEDRRAAIAAYRESLQSAL